MSQEAKTEFDKIADKDESINYLKRGFRGGNNREFDFTNFSSLRKLFRATFYGQILIPAAEKEQDDFDEIHELLKTHKPRKDSRYNKLKEDLLINAKHFYDGREMIVKAFKDKLFSLSDPSNYPYYTENDSEKDKVSFTDKTYKSLADELYEILSPGLVSEYFENNSLIEKSKQLEYFRRLGKKSIAYKNKMAKIALGFWKSKKDIKNMSENEVKNKGLDLLKDFIKKIVDMSPLESEEEAAQKGQGLKIFTPLIILLDYLFY